MKPNSAQQNALLFPLCTFDRVFDTAPVQEALTLEELMFVLRRFELRPKIKSRLDRQIERLDASYARWKEGKDPRGKFSSKIMEAERTAKRNGDDVSAAVEAEVEHLRENIRQQGKRELRIWSPTQYADGAIKRGADNVRFVSCLVLDFDDGTPIPEASATWEEWFHIVHTTWSHTSANPKFRLILPLGQPVPSKHWPEVWNWAEERTGKAIDPACKSPASTYALPAIPHPEWLCQAFCHEGALLNPVYEGIVPNGSPPPTPIISPDVSLVAGYADSKYIERDDPDPAKKVEDNDEWDDQVWSICGESTTNTEQSEAVTMLEDRVSLVNSCVEAEAPNDMQEISNKLDLVIERIDRLTALFESPAMIGQSLERLEKMFERGMLTKKEFRLAKAKLLGPTKDKSS